MIQQFPWRPCTQEQGLKQVFVRCARISVICGSSELEVSKRPYKGLQEDSDRDGMWVNLEDTGISELMKRRNCMTTCGLKSRQNYRHQIDCVVTRGSEVGRKLFTGYRVSVL